MYCQLVLTFRVLCLKMPLIGQFAECFPRGISYVYSTQSTGVVIRTYIVITTTANELTRDIHNTKQRMLVILSRHTEIEWLRGGDLVRPNDYKKSLLVGLLPQQAFLLKTNYFLVLKLFRYYGCTLISSIM